MANVFGTLVGGIALLGLGSYWIYKGIEPLYWTTVLLRSTSASVREGKNTDGIVGLEGQAVKTDGRVESPFTETTCLAYGCKIEQNRRRGGRWNTIYSDRDGVPFRLEDDTGGAGVDPATATLFLGSRDTIDSWYGSAPSEAITSYLRRRNIEGGGTSDGRRYTEQRFAAGDEIYVYGPITNRPITTMANDFNAPVRDGTESSWFLITDTDRLATLLRLLKPNLKTLVGALGVLLGAALLWSVLALII